MTQENEYKVMKNSLKTKSTAVLKHLRCSNLTTNEKVKDGDALLVQSKVFC